MKALKLDLSGGFSWIEPTGLSCLVYRRNKENCLESAVRGGVAVTKQAPDRPDKSIFEEGTEPDPGFRAQRVPVGYLHP